MAYLIRGKQLCIHFIQAQPLRYILAHGLCVARQHDGLPDSRLFQFPNRKGRILLHFILDQNSSPADSVLCHVDNRSRLSHRFEFDVI